MSHTLNHKSHDKDSSQWYHFSVFTESSHDSSLKFESRMINYSISNGQPRGQGSFTYNVISRGGRGGGGGGGGSK